MELVTEASAFYDMINSKIKELGGDRALHAELFSAVMIMKKCEVKMADVMCAYRTLKYNTLTTKLNVNELLQRNEIIIYVEAKGIYERHKAGLVMNLELSQYRGRGANKSTEKEQPFDENAFREILGQLKISLPKIDGDDNADRESK